jgi:deleted-in-malignant-brain-tumors protein 1
VCSVRWPSNGSSLVVVIYVVFCVIMIVCAYGAIRLQGGTTMQGRVEICNNNVWGTVCDDFWGAPDASVACRQLGFSPTGLLSESQTPQRHYFSACSTTSGLPFSVGAVALTTGFTNGAGQIWLDNVQCTGTEENLLSCTHNTLGNHNCVHAEDAGVRCQPGK